MAIKIKYGLLTHVSYTTLRGVYKAQHRRIATSMYISTQEHWGRSWCRVEAMLAAAKPVAEGRAALFSGGIPVPAD